MSLTHVALTTRLEEVTLCYVPLADTGPTIQVSPANPNYLDIASLALTAFSVEPCPKCQDIVESVRRVKLAPSCLACAHDQGDHDLAADTCDGDGCDGYAHNYASRA